MLSRPLPFRNMTRAGFDRQANRSEELLKRTTRERLDNYEPRHKVPKGISNHRLAFHFMRWPAIKLLVEARRTGPELATYQGVVKFDTKTIQKQEVEAAKLCSLLWTEKPPFFKNQELLTEAQLRAAAPEVLGFDLIEERYYMLFRSLEENCGRGE